MLNFNIQNFFFFLFLWLCSSNIYQALSCEREKIEDQSGPRVNRTGACVQVFLDTYGEGRREVSLPLEYYERQEEDKFSIIHQGYYKLYDISESPNKVVILAPLSPCIGIVVTDGLKLVAFHKHFSTSSQSMLRVIRENLDLSDPDNLYARLYSAKNDKEWEEREESKDHGDKSHLEEIEKLLEVLKEFIKLPSTHIWFDLPSVESPKKRMSKLGRYEGAPISIAVRLNRIFEKSDESNKRIYFMLIDPITEDIFGYREKEFPLSYVQEVTIGRALSSNSQGTMYVKDIAATINRGVRGTYAGQLNPGQVAQRIFYSKQVEIEEEEKRKNLLKELFNKEREDLQYNQEQVMAELRKMKDIEYRAKKYNKYDSLDFIPLE